MRQSHDALLELGEGAVYPPMRSGAEAREPLSSGFVNGGSRVPQRRRQLLGCIMLHPRQDMAITADATASTLEGIVARRGTAPAYIRCD